jgi:putative ABC transport system permease protein
MTPTSNKRPPRTAAWLLETLANRDEKAAILGDLSEEYVEIASDKGTIKAALWYWGLILASIPSFVRHTISGSLIMFKNHFKVAFRVVKRHRGFSFINVAGLSLGLAASLLIGIYLKHELSFDRHNIKADRIFRVCVQSGVTDQWRGAYTAPPMAEAMKAELPEIAEVVRLDLWPGTSLVEFQEKSFLERGVIYADGSIFKIFTLPLILGDAETALTAPFSVVISQTTALKYFGGSNPLGKVLHFKDRKQEFKVTGVVPDCSSLSHFRYDMIASLVSERVSRDPSWGSHTFFTYLLLHQGKNPVDLEQKFPDFVRRHWGAYQEADTGLSWEELQKDENYIYGFFLEPLLDIHLNPHVGDNLSVKGSPASIVIFSSIALIILLVACINFMNLSTARFAHRYKEVGVRKVLGSGRKQLIAQFLGESGLLALLALGCALVFLPLVLPAFSKLAQRDLSLSVLMEPTSWMVLIGIALLVGVLAGSYPAIFLSGFQPGWSLRGGHSGQARGHMYLRRALVIFQFGVTFAILFGTLVISSQLKYLRHKDLGFDKEQVLVIHRARGLGRQFDAFKQELQRYPEILAVSNSESLPGRHFNPNSHVLEGRPRNEHITLHTIYADHTLADLLGLELVAGRYFSPEIATDATSAVVINETAVRELGLQDPIGKRFHKEFGGAKPGEFVTIIGVLKDFHFLSLHYPILPMLIRPLSSSNWRLTSLKIQSPDLPSTISRIEQAWQRFTGGQPFEYSFLDEDFNRLYRNEQRTGTIFAAFALLAVVIACLGLFGLVSYMAEKRTKEIGIRKVLGAGTSRIVHLLSKEVVILVGIAVLVTGPLAFYFMSRWLQNFAFRIGLNPIHFLIALLITVSVSLLSIGYRVLKAAHGNPAKALKYE